jgi:hypothetical protein
LLSLAFFKLKLAASATLLDTMEASCDGCSGVAAAAGMSNVTILLPPATAGASGCILALSLACVLALPSMPHASAGPGSGAAPANAAAKEAANAAADGTVAAATGTAFAA